MHECGCNYLRACLLLLIAERADHGYDLASRLTDFGLDAVDTPSTYRALRALERDGMVASVWMRSLGGPARRVYRLAAAGEAALLSYGEELRRDQRRVAQYLHRLEATVSLPGRAADTVPKRAVDTAPQRARAADTLPTRAAGTVPRARVAAGRSKP
jgi:DNA-binding PadR family transcriptional regulator